MKSRTIGGSIWSMRTDWKKGKASRSSESQYEARVPLAHAAPVRPA
jgi:hypothetical protein